MLLGAATAAAISLTAAASAQEANLETVVITGSRIPQTGLVGASPVTTLGQQEMTLQGATNISTSLLDMPAVNADGDDQFVNNGSGGIATVDLRNLGSNRTLVLVDGHRLVAADTSNDIDLNMIPSSVVDHIEIQTGGASAVYGSDAVSGVVNIILKKDFEGMKIDGEWKTTDHGDGQTTDLNALLGVNSANGKGNVTIYADYTVRLPVMQADRSYSSYALQSPTYAKGSCTTSRPAIYYGGLCHGGSSFIAEGHVFSSSLANSGPASYGSTTMFTASHKLANYDGRTFNFAPYNYYQTPNTRYSFGATGHYEVNKNIDVYTRLTFAENHSRSQLAPTPLGAGFAVNFGNPLMSDQERDVIFGGHTIGTALCGSQGSSHLCTGNSDTMDFFLGRRLVENGPRVQIDDRSAYQMVLGVKGNVPLLDGWAYDVSAQYGRTLQTRRLEGDASFTRFQQGLLVTTSGQCEDTSGGCVPIDIFAPGQISQNAVNFFTLSMEAVGHINEWVVNGFAEGDLPFLQSPFAAHPVSMVAGFEWRKESSDYQPDDNLATGNLLGFNAEPAISGDFNVAEGFTEVQIPLAENQPFMKKLQVDGAYRYSAYSYPMTGGHSSANTWHAKVEWSPIDDLKFRASQQRAVRAPNIYELYSPYGTSANNGVDPCSGAGTITHTAALTALCVAPGVPSAAVYNNSLTCPSGQCEATNS